MKNYFKPITGLLLAGLMAFSVTACAPSSGKGSSAAASSKDSPATDPSGERSAVDAAPEPASQAEPDAEGFPYTFTDIAGREITIDTKPETFIVGNYILNFMLIGGSKSLERVIGMPLDGWKETRMGEYTAMTSSFPEILDKTSIGGYHDDVLDSELILTKKPDVLLINLSQYSENETSIPVFEKAGIHVVVLDYHKLKLENHVKSTEILGRLLGREETAEEMIKDYTSAINLVQERILSSGKEPRKVYMELGNNGIGEYGNSYTGCLWGSIIDAAGGINIADEVLDPSEGYGPLDREFVLAQNPDIIIIGGSIWTGGNSGNDQMRMGLTVKKDMALERLSGFTGREGWKNLTAIQNGEVYGVDHGSLRFMGDYVYTEAIAKMIYPDLFEDIDPQAEMEHFYEKYLPEMDHTGTYYIKWQGNKAQ